MCWLLLLVELTTAITQPVLTVLKVTRDDPTATFNLNIPKGCKDKNYTATFDVTEGSKYMETPTDLTGEGDQTQTFEVNMTTDDSDSVRGDVIAIVGCTVECEEKPNYCVPVHVPIEETKRKLLCVVCVSYYNSYIDQLL